VTETRRKAHDKELVRERTLDVLAHYLRAPGKDQGSRTVWDCPSCGKAEKFAVKKAEKKGGCLVAGCSLEGYEDVFSLVARFEELDYRTDFLRVLEKAHEALGLYPDGAQARTEKCPSNGRSPRNEPDSVRTVPLKERRGLRAGVGSEAPGGAGATPVPEEEVRELAAFVYGRILDLCPLDTRDRDYLRRRGLSHETIKRGRFGTMTAARARGAKAALLREIGREALLSVPGFSEDEGTGRLKFTLAGDYLLIPYHDAEGRVTTIEGRAAGKVPEGMGKYVSLRRAGNHLYLFPGHRPEDLLAVCEGVMGALAAAEAGLPVGAIQGCERYRASLAPECPDGKPGAPLLELSGTDFGGRLLPYVPDADDPPNPRVLRAAPKAARWLAEPHNARPAICLLPVGTDLDDWLLSLPPDERQHRFEELLGTAVSPEDGAVPMPGPTSKAPAPNGRRPPTRDRAAKGRHRGGRDDSGERSSVPSDKQPASPEENHVGSARRASPGARRLRDEVYRAMLEALPLKEAHLEALSRRGVMRETARAGGLASLDEGRADAVAGKLAKRFGARRLLSVPGFERAGRSSARLALRGEYLLLRCFDGEGLLSAVEALPVGGETGRVSGEETVPLPGAGDHLYVFAPYRSEEVEGFCEGALGALLAARYDVVVGAIGGYRRYGPGVGLPELDGVDLTGRTLAYVPRAGCGEENARYHEAEKAARRLIERHGGRPLVAGVREDESEDGPTSLAEWIPSLPEDEAHRRLRELFPENPRRRNRTDIGGGGHDEHAEAEGATPVQGPRACRWELHETPRKESPPTVPVTPSEAVLAVLAWLAVYLATDWLLKTTERLIALAAHLEMLPAVDDLVADPALVRAAIATLVAAFVLWRRRAMRVGEARMLSGKIEH